MHVEYYVCDACGETVEDVHDVFEIIVRPFGHRGETTYNEICRKCREGMAWVIVQEEDEEHGTCQNCPSCTC